MSTYMAAGLVLLVLIGALQIASSRSISAAFIWFGHNFRHLVATALGGALIAGACGVIGWDDVERALDWTGRIAEKLPWYVWLALLLLIKPIFTFIERHHYRRSRPPGQSRFPPYNPFGGPRGPDNII